MFWAMINYQFTTGELKNVEKLVKQQQQQKQQILLKIGK